MSTHSRFTVANSDAGRLRQMQQQNISFFNEKQPLRKNRRQLSDSYQAKALNNFTKAIIIQRHIPHYKTIMDLGCGHGQDTRKYEEVNPECVFFMDIGTNPLNELVRRCTFAMYPHYIMWGDFSKPDFVRKCQPMRMQTDGSIKMEDNPELCNRLDSMQWDVLCSQFAIQYSLWTEKDAHVFLANVSKYLKSGGKFICSIIDADVVNNLVINGAIRNDLFQLEFHDRDKLQYGFGDVYTYNQLDCVTVQEPLVPVTDLARLAKDHGLQLMYTENFNEIVRSALDDKMFHTIAKRMRVLPHNVEFRKGHSHTVVQNLDSGGMLVNHMYRMCVFVKDPSSDQQ